ncbi:hypothetical protein HS088_TW06G00025 [Tripterygium wilfordii]|uniref:Uncharacterized protein n=1 Tax=Tripterygium wilfordii TaxID=458696 RepID=A0A7J7DHN7_TRIWF|nr:hypothetical protein HS088_TW06G00025 [Tripterygium wilfordii]
MERDEKAARCSYGGKRNGDVGRYEASRAKGLDNYDRDLEDVIDRLILSVIRKLNLEKTHGYDKQIKLPARQEPPLDSSKYTAADVRITDQKLRVCDICGAFLSVYDSDRRLADHFGGKLHLGYMQIREKLAELQEERNKSSKVDRHDDRRSKERSREREREPSKDRDRGDSRERVRDSDRKSKDHKSRDRDRHYDRDRDREYERSRSYDSRSRRRSRSRSRERSRDYDRHRRYDRH